MRYRMRFGVRARLAGLALGLLAVPFALLLLLVSGRWDRLLELHQGAIEGLHDVALSHGAFVAVLNLISTIGSAWLYLPLFTALSIWLAAQCLRRWRRSWSSPWPRARSSTHTRRVPSIAPGPSCPNLSLMPGVTASPAARRRTRPSRPASS